MKTKEGGKSKRFILFFMFLIISLAIPIQSFAALPTFYSNPKTHYDKYGTEIQYMSNHEIAFAGAIIQGNVDIRTRVIGYTATVTANGQTAKVIYKRGNSNMSGWDVSSPGFTVNKTTVGENTYLLYRIKYANFQDDVYEANKTLGTYLARGDYDVSVKFDAITEVYSSVSGKTLDGPNTTKTQSRDALTKYNLDPSIWDSSYGMMMNMSKSDLPVVNFITKSLTLPSTGAYQSGSTYYVQPGRQISVSTTYKSNIVNLTRQILKLGDPGGYSYVNDYIGAFEYGSQTFVEDDPGTIDFLGGTGSTASNADKNAKVTFKFALKDSARNWTAFGEAYNQRELYAGGFKRSYETLYNFVSDGDGPRIFRLPSSDWTNQDVTFNPGVSDNMIGATADSTSEVAPGSGLDSTTLYRGATAIESFTNTGGRTSSYAYNALTISSTTSFKLTAKDNVGNTSTETFTVNIDKVMPSINLNYDSSWTNQNVPISWSASDSGGSGVKDVVLPNGTITTATSGTYTATSSGTQRFIVTDNAGNIKVQDIVVNIDKTNPTATKSQTPTSWTNDGVTLNLTGVSDSGGSGLLNIVKPSGAKTTGTSASEMVYANGTYTFDVNDRAGNTSSYTFEVTNIDTDAPNGTVSQTPTGYAPNGVTISLTNATDTGGSGVKGIRLPNGTFVSGTSASQLVTDNGNYTFQVEDNAGNITNKSISVSNITAPDSIPPTGTVTQTPTSWTNGSVTLNLTNVKDTGGSGLKSSNTIKLPSGSFVSGTSASQTVSSNGTYVFEMYDNEGNVGTASITVTNIDKTSPTANISQSPTSWTDGDVTLTLSSIADSGGSGLASITMPDGTVQTTFTTKTYTVSSNGTYTFKVEDKAGNETTRSITVSNIDKIAPTGTLSQTPTGWTDGNVTLNLTGVADSGGSGFKQITLPNGTTTSTTMASQVVTTNGTYSFTIEDNAGNITTKTIKVSNIDKTSPTGTLSQTPTAWTKGNVTLSLTGVADTGGSGFKQITLPNGSTTSSTTASQVVSVNGNYTFTIEDNAGNVTTKTINVSNIDKIDPTANLSQTPTAWTNGNVTLNLTSVSDSGGSGVDSIELPDGTMTTGTSASYTVTTNGTYTFRVTDNAGNIATRTISVTNIDKSAPSATLTQTPTSWTNGTVTLDLSSVSDIGSGVKNITLPNGTIVTTATASYTVSVNGSYTFKIQDNAGNITNKTVNVTNIDRQSPTGDLSQTPVDWTTGNVTLTLNNIADGGGSGFKSITYPNGTVVVTTIATYTATSNGTYTFKIEDNAGNVTTKSITVSNIDKVRPTASLSSSTTDWTNQDVTLSLTNVADSGGSGLNTITLPDNTVVSPSDLEYTVTKNGTYKFLISDNAGNVTTLSIVVGNIDKTLPTASLTKSTASWTNDTVTLNLTSITDTASGVKKVTMPDGTVETTATDKAYDVSTNGTYTFKIEDNAGNIRTLSISVTNIDKIAPTGTLSQTPTSWTNGSVTLNVTGVADTGGSAFKQITFPNGSTTSSTTASQVVTSNGSYTFLIEDNAGNITTKTINVTNIDKTAPTANLTQTPTSWTKGSVTLNLTSVSDSGGSGLDMIKLPDGTIVTGTSASYAVSANGTYSFVVYDNAGNATTKSITVSNIDQVAPTGTLSQTPTTWTNGVVQVTLLGISDSASGIKQIQKPDGTIVSDSTSVSYDVTANGNYTFKVTDKAENVSIFTHTVSNIDKVAPTASFTPNGVAWKNTAQSVAVSLSDTGGSSVKSWRYRTSSDDGASYGTWSSLMTTTSGTISLNGHGMYRIQVEVTDNAGNAQTVTTNPYQLDMVKPSITATPNTTAPTNGNVTISVSASDADSGISRIKLPDGTMVSADTASYVVSTNGTYSFETTDVAGNTETTVVTLSNIDKVKPTATLTQTPTSWTNGNVTLNLTNVADTGGSGLKTTGDIKLPNGTFVTGTSASQVVTANGTYTFVVYDNAGNTESLSITVSNIDKVKPSGTTQLIPGTTALTIQFNGTDTGSGVDSVTLPNGVKVSGSTASYSTTTAGTYTATVLDRAGNTGMISVTVQEPTVILDQEVTNWTNRKDYKLTVSGTPQYGSTLRIQAPFVSSTWTNTNRLETTITKNGSYSFVVSDGGIQKTLTIDVTNFDRARPMIDIQEKNRTTNDTTANIRVFERGDVK